MRAFSTLQVVIKLFFAIGIQTPPLHQQLKFTSQRTVRVLKRHVRVKTPELNEPGTIIRVVGPGKGTFRSVIRAALKTVRHGTVEGQDGPFSVPFYHGTKHGPGATQNGAIFTPVLGPPNVSDLGGPA